jgi:predicted regulator of Ras-like GTPase activity (Roadblock/LC7/MglB family)
MPGVRGSNTVTTDGRWSRTTCPALSRPDRGLVAATRAVAARASLSTESGPLKEVITRGNDGYLAVYAAGAPPSSRSSGAPT